MLHDVILTVLGPPLADGVPDGGTTVALYGLLGVVVTALAGVAAAYIQRGRSGGDPSAADPLARAPITVDQQFINELRSQRAAADRRADAAESQCDQVTAEATLLRKGIRQLREAMIQGGTTMPDSVLTDDVKAIL